LVKFFFLSFLQAIFWQAISFCLLEAKGISSNLKANFFLLLGGSSHERKREREREREREIPLFHIMIFLFVCCIWGGFFSS
jgi:hypothetical protein